MVETLPPPMLVTPVTFKLPSAVVPTAPLKLTPVLPFSIRLNEPAVVLSMVLPKLIAPVLLVRLMFAELLLPFNVTAPV